MTCPARISILIVLPLLLSGAAAIGDETSEPPAADVASAVTLFELVLDADPETAKECLGVLTAKIRDGELGARQIGALRPRLEETLAGIVQDTGHPLHFDAALLSAMWRDAAGLRTMRAAFADPGLPERQRLDALGALVAARDPGVAEAAGRVLAGGEESSVTFRGRTLAALGRLDDPKLAEVVLARYAALEPELRPRAVELLTQRVAWARRLVEAVEAEAVPAADLNLNQVRRLSSLDERLAERARGIWGVIREGRNPEREQVIAEMRELILATPGDPRAGQAVFRKACAQCHKIFGEGEEVGPDLTENGRSTFDQLLSNVFDPSLVIGAAYQAHTVLTTDGRVLTGLLVEDSPQRLVLKGQGGKLETVTRADVEEHQVSDVSLMPDGLEKQLTPQEIADLFAFLMRETPPE